MPSAPIPSNEAERLAALHAYDILDTSPEKAFDDLTRIAAHICQTPIVLVSLVDGERQWFKSRIGMDDTETSREVSFCAHAILDQHHVMTVPDATQDPRFADNPLVTGDFHLRFYAGAPLVSSTGHAVGALCVIDHVSRQLSEAQRDALEVLGRQIVAQMELRRDLVVLRRQVEQEITDRRRVERERETALAAAKARAEFLAVMSHELRTPMNGVIGMTDLALEMAQDTTQRSYLQTVKSSAASLLTILNEILDFSKIEAGQLRMENIAFEPRGLLTELVRSLQGRLDSKQLTFHLDVSTDMPALVSGDPGRLRQVLLNLCDNAIKFTAQGGLTLRVYADAQADHWHFALRDTGMGIPADKQKLIFDAFSQADASTTREFGGTGLGLTICARLVGMMGGRIWVESEYKRGSTFHFTVHLPAVARVAEIALDPAATALPVPDVASAQGRNILLVEDHPVNQMLARTLLERAGHKVTLAENGKQAIELFDTARWDLILMDLQMPVMGGIEATRQIRAMELPGTRVPIIAVTANAMETDRVATELAGMDAHLAKPFNKTTLLEVLTRFT